MADIKEIAKELTLAIIPRINYDLSLNDNLAKNECLAEEVAKVYQIIYEAVKQG